MKFYGFLSNQSTAALIDPAGSVDWLCFPRFDSPAVFARLLGEKRNGYYAVVPDGAFTARQRYLPHSNVLETVLSTPAGSVRLRDCLTIGRPELRRLVDTEVPITVRLVPSFGYGLLAPSVRALEHGAVFQNPMDMEALVFHIRCLGKAKPEHDADIPRGCWRLPPGRYDLVLRYLGSETREGMHTLAAIQQEGVALEAEELESDTRPCLERILQFWQSLPADPGHGPYREVVERSLLVLHGLIYGTSGAIIAAPTTSLPEAIGQSRQWDYRFAWIRDGSYAAEALLEAQDTVSARRFLEFLFNRVDLEGKPFPAPFFHVDGTLIRGEQELGWLAGFRGSRPCREGNAATHQVQLDVEGDFVWTVYRYVEATGDDAFLRFYWHRLTVIVEWVARNWNTTDASLWEFREQNAHYTHSKLMCWVALHYGARLAARLGHPREAERWQLVADQVRQAIDSQGFSAARGTYTQAFGNDRLDAALLLMPLYGFLPADHPRFSATLAAIEQELVQGHFVYRYDSDMLGKAAHPFVLATSWLARVYIRRGESERARALIDGLVATATDLGLLGEHADMETGEPRGNFPQAFSHLGLVMAALEWERAQADTH